MDFESERCADIWKLVTLSLLRFFEKVFFLEKENLPEFALLYEPWSWILWTDNKNSAAVLIVHVSFNIACHWLWSRLSSVLVSYQYEDNSDCVSDIFCMNKFVFISLRPYCICLAWHIVFFSVTVLYLFDIEHCISLCHCVVWHWTFRAFPFQFVGGFLFPLSSFVCPSRPAGELANMPSSLKSLFHFLLKRI